MAQGFTNRRLGFAGNGLTKVFVNGVKQNSTSGTEIDFTIPSGVKKISIPLQDVSLSGTSQLTCQIGDSSGVVTTGYVGTTGFVAGASQGSSAIAGTGWHIHTGLANAAHEIMGLIELVLLDEATNLWVCTFNGGTDASGTGHNVFWAGNLSLSGELTTVRLTARNGTDTLDNGTINVQYDNPDPAVVAEANADMVLQVVQDTDSTYQTGTTTIPIDNTKPQNTEGDEYLTVSITPRKSTSLLKVEVNLQVSPSGTSGLALALFLDSESDARAVAYDYHGVAEEYRIISLVYYMTAGQETSMTFKARAGMFTAGTLNVNGEHSAGARFNNTLASNITVTEYRQ